MGDPAAAAWEAGIGIWVGKLRVEPANGERLMGMAAEGVETLWAEDWLEDRAFCKVSSVMGFAVPDGSARKGG